VVNYRRTPQIDDGVCFWKHFEFLSAMKRSK
jgi:hypothetical protein